MGKIEKLDKKSGTRLSGRNTYPTNKPEPHGYEFYLTVRLEIKPDDEIEIKEIKSGLFAVLQFKNLQYIREA